MKQHQGSPHQPPPGRCFSEIYANWCQPKANLKTRGIGRVTDSMSVTGRKVNSYGKCSKKARTNLLGITTAQNRFGQMET
eukprot:g15611.t1